MSQTLFLKKIVGELSSEILARTIAHESTRVGNGQIIIYFSFYVPLLNTFGKVHMRKEMSETLTRSYREQAQTQAQKTIRI